MYVVYPAKVPAARVKLFLDPRLNPSPNLFTYREETYKHINIS